MAAPWTTNYVLQNKNFAGSYANANKMVVLIDEEKIEKMAEDENYRKQYEGIIANAATGLSSMSSKISATGASVKGFGMQVNDDGTASYFAVQILLLCLEIFLGVLHNEIDDKHRHRKDQKGSQGHPHIDGQHHHKYTDQGGN